MITVNIKHTNDAKVSVEVSEDNSILEVKEKIHEKFPDIPPNQQRLIYSGKILKDEDKVSTYSIKDGNTLHLVKSGKAATTPAATTSAKPAASTVPTTTAAPQQRSPTTSTSQQPPMDFASMLNGQMNLSGMDQSQMSFGGMDPSQMMNDPAMQSMLQNPAMMQMSMQMIANNPQLMEAIVNSNPALRNMPPEMRRLMFSPEMISMMSNPAIMSQMQQMRGSMAGAAANNPPSPSANSFGMPAIDPNLFSQLLGGAGSTIPGATPVNSSSEPPETRFSSQLQQLQEMGFYDKTSNLQALQRFNGNVNAAIEYLLNNLP